MKLWNVILTSLVILLICIFAKETMADEQTQTSDVFVAIGDDNIRLTQKDVEELREYMEKGVNRLTEKGYINFALQLMLFAKEAKSLGLDRTDDKKPSDNPFEERMRLADMYSAKVMNEYKLDDLVIESYYLAHPQKYKTENAQSRNMDDGIKKSIREMIIVEKKFTILNTAYEQLNKKYHVRICDAQSGGCK